jgi:hypothetical protein
MDLLFDRVNVHLECETCDSPVYISSTLGHYPYTMMTVEKHANQICSACKQRLTVISITGILRKYGAERNVRRWIRR